MKKLIRLSLLLSGALLLGACSSVGTRIQQNASLFYSLDANTRAKIAHGDIDLGFTPQMVYIALGQPDVKRQSVSAQGVTETWIYRTYYDYPAWGPGWGPGWGYHRWFAPYGGAWRVYWQPMYFDAYPGYAQDNIRVTFKNGRVVMVDQVK